MIALLREWLWRLRERQLQGDALFSVEARDALRLHRERRP